MKNLDIDKYPLNYTIDNGKYIFTKLLGGAPLNGLWRGSCLRSDGRDVLISIKSTMAPLTSESKFMYGDVAGLAPVLFAGVPDRPMGQKNVVVESRPDGQNLINSGKLTAGETIRLGLSLCDMIQSWNTQIGIFSGIRPETVYVDGNAGHRYFSGATPRSFIFLCNDHMYSPFSGHCYDPPAHDFMVDIALDDEVFVVGVLMWFALLGEHPYCNIPGHPHDFNNIWEDIRHPFAGPAELGRLLEAVLVADPDRRMKALQFRAELVQLTHTWNVELPPFPPPGLWAGPASKKMTE